MSATTSESSATFFKPGHRERILEHMNEDHADANLNYVRHFGSLPAAIAARLTDLDANGIYLEATLPEAKCVPYSSHLPNRLLPRRMRIPCWSRWLSQPLARLRARSPRPPTARTRRPPDAGTEAGPVAKAVRRAAVTPKNGRGRRLFFCGKISRR